MFHSPLRSHNTCQILLIELCLLFTYQCLTAPWQRSKVALTAPWQRSKVALTTCINKIIGIPRSSENISITIILHNILLTSQCQHPWHLYHKSCHTIENYPHPPASYIADSELAESELLNYELKICYCSAQMEIY